ncbi:methyltransferase [Anditalea andensis]|uniref:Methyltransferase n=2 Tax=Anditalea andensis TaxID=1048983 RepID=A0A074KUD3_9BACT|nr:methyltransferase [Anditalea andensis]
MYERLSKCPLCKSGHFNNYMVVKDHSITQESFTLCKCNNCSFIFTNPRPDQKNIGKYYQSENYISHSDKSNNFIDVLYKMVRSYTLGQKVGWMNAYVKNKGRLLDYGCGTGHFLKRANKNGWQTIGLEPNKEAAELAVKNLNLSILQSLDDLKHENKFDAITLFHVLEHVHDLHHTLNILLQKLKKRGTLFIAVPNNMSFDAIHFKEKWAALDVPRHLYHFNQETMGILAEEFNLRIVDAVPMKFDSYYVSILSDKITNSGNNLLKSIINGYKSNNYAKNNKNNYSSLLFILRKK